MEDNGHWSADRHYQLTSLPMVLPDQPGLLAAADKGRRKQVQRDIEGAVRRGSDDIGHLQDAVFDLHQEIHIALWGAKRFRREDECRSFDAERGGLDRLSHP